MTKEIISWEKNIKVTITSLVSQYRTRKSTKPSLPYNNLCDSPWGWIRFEFQRTVWQSRPRIDHWDSLVVVDQSVRSNISHNLRRLCRRSSEFPACITLQKLFKRIVFGVKSELIVELTFSGNSRSRFRVINHFILNEILLCSLSFRLISFCIQNDHCVTKINIENEIFKKKLYAISFKNSIRIFI